MSQFTAKLRLTLQWRDAVAQGGMIQARNYTKSYMGFNQVSQKELDAICIAANAFYKHMDSPLRIGNHMGELIPGLEPQRSLIPEA